jgi:hypothetical protein
VFNIEAEIKRANRRTKREEATPLVVYTRGGSYGLARLASIRDYMAMHSWPPEYSGARIITDPHDIFRIAKAQETVRIAREAADQIYAQAFARGDEVDAEAAESAAAAIGD